MIRKIRVSNLVSLLKFVSIIGLMGYCLIASVLLLRPRAEPILIGIDSYGTRVIRSLDDRLIKQEKENFLKKYLTLQYNYDSENFESRISEAGDLMSKEFWIIKNPEFLKLSERLRQESLKQTALIQDIREIDPETYQADIEIHVHNKLKQSSVKLRIDLKISRNQRSEVNPYPYEVVSHDEQVIP